MPFAPRAGHCHLPGGVRLIEHELHNGNKDEMEKKIASNAIDNGYF